MTPRTFQCLFCDHRFDFDHLKVGTSFGPWYCDECGNGMNGTVTNDSVDVTIANSKEYKTLDLLHLNVRSVEPIFLLHQGFHIGKPNLSDDDIQNTDPSYYYDQHTCPSNILQMPVMEGFNTDPHGLLLFVALRPFKTEYSDWDHEDLFGLFEADIINYRIKLRSQQHLDLRIAEELSKESLLKGKS